MTANIQHLSNVWPALWVSCTYSTAKRKMKKNNNNLLNSLKTPLFCLTGTTLHTCLKTSFSRLSMLFLWCFFFYNHSHTYRASLNKTTLEIFFLIKFISIGKFCRGIIIRNVAQGHTQWLDCVGSAFAISTGKLLRFGMFCRKQSCWYSVS